MHYEIYIDVVFFTNLLIDYILIRFTGILFRCGRSRKRALLGAAAGAAIAPAVVQIGMRDVAGGQQQLLHGALHGVKIPVVVFDAAHDALHARGGDNLHGSRNFLGLGHRRHAAAQIKRLRHRPHRPFAP